MTMDEASASPHSSDEQNDAELTRQKCKALKFPSSADADVAGVGAAECGDMSFKQNEEGSQLSAAGLERDAQHWTKEMDEVMMKEIQAQALFSRTSKIHWA